ncbi:MAG: riboflavin synthase [bacterium]|nr:riboflavin synthase [Candidatus Kapabacteria bacterium]
MFTGLIEEMGTVAAFDADGGARRLTIRAATVTEGLSVDDSVAVDGCCLTVVERTAESFTAVAVEETLSKTILGDYRIGHRVNLERALRVGDRLGGHYVLGHVDCVGTIVEANERDSSWTYWIQYPVEHGKLVIPVGSIAINGVSLTAADVRDDACMVSIIPHTHSVTTFGALKKGDTVNVEFDMIGKYVRNFT